MIDFSPIISTWECRPRVTVSSHFSREVRSPGFVYNFLTFKTMKARFSLHPVTTDTAPQTLAGNSPTGLDLGREEKGMSRAKEMGEEQEPVGMGDQLGSGSDIASRKSCVSALVSKCPDAHRAWGLGGT